MQKHIQISEEGYFCIQGEKVQDQAMAKQLMSTLECTNHHICQARLGSGEVVHIEAKSHPIWVQDVTQDRETLVLKGRYDFQEQFELSSEQSLYLDEWSRLCGLSKKGVPFIFSRSAQTKFLSEIAEPIDYDHISYQGQTYQLPEWYIENENISQGEFWSDRYQRQDHPWDLGGPHPVLTYVVPRFRLQKSKVLVAGCGKGHDAEGFAKIGHNTIGVDFSQAAIKEAKSLYGGHSEFLQGDIFQFVQEAQNTDAFDVVFEHTLFCAMNPDKRIKLIKAWHKMLRSGGALMGVFMVSHKRGGPPFGITEWELEQLLEPHFSIQFWGRLRGKESARPGRELFVYANKK